MATTTDPGWVPNSTTAKWIVPLGGSGGNGGFNLPGNGTSSNNGAYYIYTLAFTIQGTGTGTATNQISIGITVFLRLGKILRRLGPASRAPGDFTTQTQGIVGSGNETGRLRVEYASGGGRVPGEEGRTAKR